MKKTRAQRQSELQAKANEIIQQLLDWTDQADYMEYQRTGNGEGVELHFAPQ